MVLLLFGLAPGLFAQSRGDVRFEAGTATALPSGMADEDAALYGLTGLGLDWANDRLSVSSALYGGIALNGATGGDFVSAMLRAELWSGSMGPALGIVGRAYGFNVGEPFPYRNGTLRAGPALRWTGQSVELEARAEVGSGASEVELRRRSDRPARTFDEHLWNRGAVLEGSLRGTRLSGFFSAGAWSSAGGPFRSVEFGLGGAVSDVVVRGDIGWWDTPLGGEWVGGLALVIPLGGRWTVQAAGGRSGPDPLSLVEAGRQGGVMVGWRLVSLDGSAPAGLYEVRSADGPNRIVTFRLDSSEAVQVELIGAFTGWEATPMRRSGGAWLLELPVEPGTHHFGFLVDGEWYVPEDLPGNVPDDWGRENATLVVPPVTQESGP